MPTDIDLRKDLPFRKNYGIGEYNWSINSDWSDHAVPKDSIQKIIFYEYQPQVIFDIGAAIDGTINAALAAIPKGLTNTAGKAIYETLMGAAQMSGAAALEATMMNMFKSTPGAPFSESSMGYVTNLFPGNFLYQYEFPYHDDMQVEADSTEGWSNLGSKRLYGSHLGEMVKKGFNVDFPTTPQWSMSDNRGKSFNFAFDLVNDTTENTVKNWNMLNSFTAGCFWIQLNQMQKSPNVFRVELEGRWERYWCAVGVKVDTIGRLYIDSAASSRLQIKDTVKPKIRFPEAWKVQLHVCDLVQNNYNIFGKYLIDGPSNPKPGSGIDRTTKAIEDIRRQLSLAEEMGDSAQADMLKNELNKRMNELENAPRI